MDHSILEWLSQQSEHPEDKDLVLNRDEIEHISETGQGV